MFLKSKEHIKSMMVKQMYLSINKTLTVLSLKADINLPKMIKSIFVFWFLNYVTIIDNHIKNQ